MAQEKEIKIQLKINYDDFIERVKDFGYQNKGKTKQLDIYFDTHDWYLYNNIAALRIRIVDGHEHSFSFKKVFYLANKKDKYYIEEIEVPFPIVKSKDFKKIFSKLNLLSNTSFPKDSDKLTKYLKDAGYQDEQKMLKIRSKYQLNDIEITIDEIDKVGTIIELECKTSDPHVEVAKLLNDDEWERSVEGTSYIWLKNIKGFDSHLNNFKRFPIKPTWNVWENEIEFYKKISK